MSPERKLIVNADDFGLSPGVNHGIVEGYDYGIVTSASLMVHKPAAAQAAALARDRPRLSLGLHIDIGEWKYERGQWVAAYERASQDDPWALKDAVNKQLELFRSLTGAEPTHLDSHQHVHMRDPLRLILSDLADQLSVPLRHFNPCISYCSAFYGQDEQGNSLAGRLKASFLVRIIQTLPDGITELGCHPAAKLDFESTYHHERLEELEALCSLVVAEALAHQRVLLVSFSTVV